MGPFGKALRVADAVGTFAIVFILPEDINITSGSPKYHRNYLDIYLSQFSRSYLGDLMEYQRILKQRNALLKKLKSSASGDTRQLDVWDEAIIAPALRIMAARKRFIEEVKPQASEISRQISGGADTVDIDYQPRISLEALSAETEALSLLRKERTRDIKMGASLFGPHRDLIGITINGEILRSFGSMGQRKTVMIAMKLAALKILSQHRGEQAILVLDEAFAVLDGERERNLLGLLSDCGQVFLASAVPTTLDAAENAHLYELSASTLTRRG